MIELKEVEPARKPEEVPLNTYKPVNPGLARVISNEPLTVGEDEVRHVVLDMSGNDYRYLEGQSLGVLPPGVNEKGKAHKLRLYSIASARGGDRNQPGTVALCVKRVVYDHPDTKEKVYGVASNFICDRKPGDELRITGPAGKKFILPDDNNADIILLATGTGVAPFRAFYDRLYLEQSDFRGSCTLFFGAKYNREFIYLNELSQDLRGLDDQPRGRIITAASREFPEKGKVYVQHRMLENADWLLECVRRGNFCFYICGLKGMETGIDEAMMKILSATPEEWAECKKKWKKADRWDVEVY